MKTGKKTWTALLISAVLAMGVLTGCGGKTPNAGTATMDEMAAYFQEKGYIAKDAAPVNINETPGYLTDNTGGQFTDTVVADEAYDYDGIWLFWWDLENQTDNYETYESMTANSGTIVLEGGAAVLETSAKNGAFAIAFSEEYKDADKVLKDFQALESK